MEREAGRVERPGGTRRGGRGPAPKAGTSRRELRPLPAPPPELRLRPHIQSPAHSLPHSRAPPLSPPPPGCGAWSTAAALREA